MWPAWSEWHTDRHSGRPLFDFVQRVAVLDSVADRLILRMHLKNALLLVLLISVSSIGTLAQERSDSPVYKNYRSPSPSAQLKRSDIDYNLMHIFMLERKAYAGDVAAQHELGLRYLLGEGVVADTLKGAFWIKRAAEQASADAGNVT